MGFAQHDKPQPAYFLWDQERKRHCVAYAVPMYAGYC